MRGQKKAACRYDGGFSNSIGQKRLR